MKFLALVFAAGGLGYVTYLGLTEGGIHPDSAWWLAWAVVIFTVIIIGCFSLVADKLDELKKVK